MSNKELNTGDNAPLFTLPDKDGKQVSLKNMKGSWVIIYFYPKDSSPGCTIEANDFTRLLPEFRKAGAEIFGVSPDSEESHCRFAEKEDLSVTLLSDPDKMVMKEYNAWGIKNMYGRQVEGVIRSTVIIDPKGIVSHRWKKVKTAGHAEKVLEKLTFLRKT